MPVAVRAEDAPAPPEVEAGEPWEWGPSILLYLVPGQTAYLQPTLTADHGALHLEGRYNYEARDTGSAFVGWNLSFGETLELGLTPMIGAVFGRTNGVAPALTLTLEWSGFSLWSQSEYVFVFGDRDASFFYSWTELAVTNSDWLRFGVAIQRTRAFQTSTEFQGGPFLALNVWKLTAAGYLFAPAQQDQFGVLSLSGAF